MATPDDLIPEVLEVLGVSAAGQPIAEEDAAKVRNAIPGVLSELNRRGIGYFMYEFDEAYKRWLGVIVANAVASKFGQSFDQAAEAIAELRIRDMNPRRPFETIPVEFF